MIEDAIRSFAQENFSHKYFPVLHGETDKIQPLALAVKQHRPIWKRPFAKSEIVILAGFDRFVRNSVQRTVRESITAKLRDEELPVKQNIDLGARDNEFDIDVPGLGGGTIKLCENLGIVALGNLSQNYIDDPDLRGILANAELDANKMKTFAECDKLLLITSVIYSEQFELKGKRMKKREMAGEVGNLPPSLQFLNLNRNSPLKIKFQDKYFPPDAVVRNSQAPFLFKCCRVDYNKETNRLEICKGEYVGKVVTQHRSIDATSSEDDEYDGTLVATTDQTDLPDCFTAEDVDKLEKIIRMLLLPEKTTARRKARVSKYLHWFEKALMSDENMLTLDEPLTLEDCAFLRSTSLPCEENETELDLTSLSTEEIQDYGIAFKVLDDLSDEQWRAMEKPITAVAEY